MAPPPPSISFVLLAYNEEESILDAIEDCRQFAQSRALPYEIIVVDDGSRDQTKAIAEAANDGHLDVRVIVHDRNRGMGASMRDGYLAATRDYIAHLPGDRQVRAEALSKMVPLVAPNVIPLSVFENPPSGRSRAVMSVAFRQLTRHVGGMQVNFAGTYLFHRGWLQRVDLSRADSDTFLFSFQLLELFRRAGASFPTVKIRTYPREHGTSREATAGRIAKMFVEIGRARVKG